MKSKVESSCTSRARSLRKIAAPLSTPTKMMACPAKSRVISAPSSLTRCAICWRVRRIFKFDTAHICNRIPEHETEKSLKISRQSPVASRQLKPTSESPRQASMENQLADERGPTTSWRLTTGDLRLENGDRSYEPERHQTHLARPRDLPHSNPRRKNCPHRPVGDEQSNVPREREDPQAPRRDALHPCAR